MSTLDRANGNLSLNGTYPCPICRRGQIAAMPMMEVLACNFCSHVFEIDRDRHTLAMADHATPLSWQWNGHKWQSARRQGEELGLFIGLIGVVLIVLPTTLVGLAGYTFAPLDDSPLSWVPPVWTVLTCICHLYFVVAFVAEYYQLPVFAYRRAILRHLFGSISVR